LTNLVVDSCQWWYSDLCQRWWGLRNDRCGESRPYHHMSGSGWPRVGVKQVYCGSKGKEGMGICIYIWNVAIEFEVADIIGSTATIHVAAFGCCLIWMCVAAWCRPIT
jgi:hypothetical protein